MKIQDKSKVDFKAIFKPEFAINVHAHNPWSYSEGYTHLELDYDQMCINHYTVRDEKWFFEVKLPLMEKNLQIGEEVRRNAVENTREYLNMLNEEQDFTIQNWLKKNCQGSFYKCN